MFICFGMGQFKYLFKNVSFAFFSYSSFEGLINNFYNTEKQTTMETLITF